MGPRAAGAASAAAWVAEHGQPDPSGDRGGGYVRVTPGTCRFAKWLKRTGRGRPCLSWGTGVWAPVRSQGLTLGVCTARGAADYLRASGFSATPADISD